MNIAYYSLIQDSFIILTFQTNRAYLTVNRIEVNEEVAVLM